jgi:hypothetical protein
MQKRPVGRPKKANAKKPGQLKKGECRYTFITTKEIVTLIKYNAKRENLSIKVYMENLLTNYDRTNKKTSLHFFEKTKKKLEQ